MKLSNQTSKQADCTTDTFIAERFVKTKNTEFVLSLDGNCLIYILKGNVKISFSFYKQEQLPERHFFLLPIHNSCYFQVDEDDTTILCFHLPCELISLIATKYQYKKIPDNFASKILKSSEVLDGFFDRMDIFLKDGLKNNEFFKLKFSELIYLLNAYYPLKDLQAFFNPILNRDSLFVNAVRKNIQQANSVKELAELLHYSTSGLEKRFKKVFGVPAGKWITEERAKNIYNEIRCTKKTFSEIAFEYGFYSPSHFYSFCKTHFGDIPGKIRKRL